MFLWTIYSSYVLYTYTVHECVHRRGTCCFYSQLETNASPVSSVKFSLLVLVVILHHLSTSDITHMRKDIRFCSTLSYREQLKAGWGPRNDPSLFNHIVWVAAVILVCLWCTLTEVTNLLNQTLVHTLCSLLGQHFNTKKHIDSLFCPSHPHTHYLACLQIQKKFETWFIQNVTHSGY